MELFQSLLLRSVPQHLPVEPGAVFSGYEPARQGKHGKKIHFAGEHCSTNFQGFMEGGAEEGARAASEILTDYQNGIFP